MSIKMKSKGSKSVSTPMHPRDVDLFSGERSVLGEPTQSFTSKSIPLLSSQYLSLLPSTAIFVRVFESELVLDGDTGALGKALASILFSPIKPFRAVST